MYLEYERESDERQKRREAEKVSVSINNEEAGVTDNSGPGDGMLDVKTP